MKKRFTAEEARLAAAQLGIWGRHRIPFAAFKEGLNHELEHRDVTGGDPVQTGKIAVAHLREDPRYYEKLKRMESGHCG